MHAKPSPTRVVLGYVAIVCTVVSWLIYMITMILSLFVNNPSLTLRFVVEGVLYMTIVTTLIFSALVYLVTRQGALYRFIRHERVPRAMLDDHFAHNYNKGITVLIPSYVEQPKVVEKTIWSAALQEFPDLAVVLLIDDPPHPKNDEARAILKASRELMPKVLAELAAPAERFTKARDETAAALVDQMDARRSVVARCAEDYRAAAQWLEHKADTWLVEDHTDDFFCDQVLRGLARDLGRSLGSACYVRELRRTARQVELAVRNTGSAIAPEDLPHVFDRFYRADKARTCDDSGHGLGLAIARAIAEEHGGTLSAESDETSGTTFTLTLPTAES